MHRFFLCLTVLVAVILYQFPAQAKDDRLTTLEKKVDALQRTYLKNNAEVASTISRAHAVQEDFAALKGTVDANKHLMSAQRKELERLILDLEQRLGAIEDRLDMFSTQLMSALKKISPDVAKEGELYQQALSKMNSGDYLKAAADFQSFLKQYSKSPFAISAQYWVGECFFSVKDYKRAIKEFQKVIKKAPRHEKAVTALLRQGDSFYELGLLEESKAFFEKLVRDFPSSPEAYQAKLKIQRITDKTTAKTDEPASPSAYPTQTIEQQRSRYKKDVTPTEEKPKSDLDEF